MSAFLCSADHHAALGAFGAMTGGSSVFLNVDPRYLKGWNHPELEGAELATAYANELLRANERSLRARYGDEGEDPPITVSQRDMLAVRRALSPVQILKLCDCCEYQSCETSDWESSLACALLDAIRRAAIRQLPGYGDADWALKPTLRDLERRAAA